MKIIFDTKDIYECLNRAIFMVRVLRKYQNNSFRFDTRPYVGVDTKVLIKQYIFCLKYVQKSVGFFFLNRA